MEMHVSMYGNMYVCEIFTSPPPLNTTLTTHIIYGRPRMGFSAGYIQYRSMGNFLNVRNMSILPPRSVFAPTIETPLAITNEAFCIMKPFEAYL